MIAKTIVVGIMIVMICILVVVHHMIRQRQQQPSPSPSSSSSFIRHHWANVRFFNSSASSSSPPPPMTMVAVNQVNISMIGIDNLSLSSRAHTTTTTTTVVIEEYDVINSSRSSKRNRMMKEEKISYTTITLLWDKIRSIFCIRCLLSYLFPNRQVHNNNTPSITKTILDSLSSTRDTKLNDRFYHVMEQCMNDTYIPLLTAKNNITINNSTDRMDNNITFTKLTNAVWLKFIQIAIQNDTDDPWGVSDNNYIESNPTYISVNVTSANNNNIISSINNNNISNNIIQLPIMEPCNTVSNFAFYRSMIIMWNLNNNILNSNIINNNNALNIVEDRSSSSWYVVPTNYRIAFVNTFGLLSWGSSLFHASNTKIGQTCDTIFISILAYTTYQMALEIIPYNPILHGIITTSTTSIEAANETNQQMTTRKKALDALKEMNTILYEQPITNWKVSIDNVVSNIPRYLMTFSVMVSALLNLALPMTIAKQVTQFLSELVLSDTTQLDYINNIFQPLFRQSITEDKLNNIRFRDRVILFLRSSGTLIKMIWAFLWQEEIISGFHIQSLFLNRLGATITPIINQIANTITGYDRMSFVFDQHFQSSNNVYPDNKRCNMLQPHSKWHEISANGLIDLLLLASDAKNIIDGGTLVIMDDNHVQNKELNNSNDKNDPLGNFSNMEDHDIVCDDNLNFLQCVMKYGMSGFDMMDRINDINSDPTVVAISNCFHYALDYLTNNNKDGSSFNNCFISNFNTASESNLTMTSLFDISSSRSSVIITESNLESTINESMAMQNNTKTKNGQSFDHCLFRNDCILFTSTWTIDLQRLSKCIQTISDDTSCQKYVADPFQLEQCLNTCGPDGNFICINECISRYNKQLSPIYKQTISSILLLVNPNRHDRSKLLHTVLLSSLSPFKETSSPPLTVMNVIINGISELTKCALVGACRTSYDRFIKTTNGIQECSSKCYLDSKSSSDSFPFLKLPKGLKCWFGCYISS